MNYEQRKRKVCEECSSHSSDACGYVSRGLQHKCGYLSDVMYGYELAQADLALTPKDLYRIAQITDAVRNEFCDHPSMFHLEVVTPENFTEAFYGEILKRFLKEKENALQNQERP